MKKLFVALMIIAAMLSITACGTTKIDVADAMTVSYRGIEGYAYSSSDVDWDALDEKLDQKRVQEFCYQQNPMYTNMILQMDGYISLFDMIFVAPADTNRYLENGDVIYYEITIDENFLGDCTVEELEDALRIRFKQTLIPLEVTGLEEAEEVDVFPVIEELVSFSGLDGYGSLEWNIPEDHSVNMGPFTFQKFIDYDEYLAVNMSYNGEYISYCTFLPSSMRGFASGDRCTITFENADVVQHEMMDLGYIFASRSKDFVVPELEKGTEIDILAEAEKHVIYYGADGNGLASFKEGTYQTQVGDIYLSYRAVDYGQNSEYNGYFVVDIVHINESLGTIYINFVDAVELSEGDKIKMEIDNFEHLDDLQDRLMEYGYVIAESERELMVPSLGAYANDISEVTQAHEADIQAQIKANIPENESDDYSSTVYELENVIIANRKPGIASDANSKLRVFYILKETESYSSFWTGDASYTYYYLMECGDLILKNDGTVGMAYSEEDFATANYRNYQTVEEALETIAENYDYSL